MNDDYVRAVLKAGQDLGVTPRGIVIAFATVYVEANWLNYANSKVPESLKLPHDAVGSDGKSVGLFQQQVVMGTGGWWWGDAATCMSPYRSALLFFQRLKRLDYNGGNSPGSYAQAVQKSAFPDRYDQRMDDAQDLYDRITKEEPVDPNRPDFNEYWVESPNSQDRGGTKVDLFLLHTQEGGGGNDAAGNLAQWLGGNVGVSYHYSIGQAEDGGVTVCDVVDTDLASWSVLSANNRSINLCFAGSRAAWTRQQWLDNAGKAIVVAAYLAVLDCKKYSFTSRVIKPPYTSDPPGISDHRYVTQHLGDGTHTDVGDGFPWDIFEAAVTHFASGQPQEPADPEPEPEPEQPADDTPADAEREVLAQTRGRWEMLGDQTLIEALAQIRDKVCGTVDAGKAGFRW